MRIYFFVLAILFSQGISFAQESNPLFRIIEGGKFGFVNKQGKVVIQPIFNYAYDFSEGLAAVRNEKGYGFIDQNGKFIISPVYDYAMPFKNGMAECYSLGKRRFIDKSGNKLFSKDFGGFDSFEHGCSIVHGQKKYHFGMINRKGKLLLDTIYQEISLLKNGAFRILRNDDTTMRYFYNPHEDDNFPQDKGYAIVDTLGNWIVPFGIYSSVRVNLGNSIVVRWPELDSSRKIIKFNEGSLDDKFEIFDYRKNNLKFHCGLVKIDSFYKENGVRKYRLLYQNQEGKCVIDDSLITFGGSFINNRAIVTRDNQAIVIDRTGKQIPDIIVDKLKEKRKSPIAADLIRRNAEYFVICDGYYGDVEKRMFYDSLGSLIHTEVDSFYDGCSNLYEQLPSGQWIKQTSNNRFKIKNDLTSNYYDKEFSQYDKRGFINGLMLVAYQGKLSYIDTKGQIIWKQKNTSWDIQKTYNVDFYTSKRELASNFPESKINKRVKNDSLTIKLELHYDTNYYDKQNVKSYVVKVLNNTQWDLSFCYKPSFVLEAKNFEGNWIAIEGVKRKVYGVDFRQNIECGFGWDSGNTEPIKKLSPGHGFEFTFPKYVGNYKTKLRIKMSSGGIVLYSNEVNGSVNYAQLWRELNNQDSSLINIHYRAYFSDNSY